MPQNTEHPEFLAIKPALQRCADAYAGTDAIKKNPEAYLPRLLEQQPAEYDAYVKRAVFYGATERTVQGLTGAAVSKPFVRTLPDSVKHLEEDATSTKMCLDELIKHGVQQVLVQGRIGLLVERDQGMEDSQPYLVPYSAAQIINWEEKNGQAVRVVLAEGFYEADAADPYKQTLCERWRELVIEDGVYKQKLHRRVKSGEVSSTGFVTEEVLPSKRGQPLNFIPFVIANADGIGFAVCKPPLLALVDINLSHYCNSADLEHGRHFTALPTPWIAGGKADMVFRIGSSAAWVFEDPQAKAGFLEFTGQGLQALEKALDQKEAQMAVLGARLLETQKAGVEAEGTVRLRQMGDIFTLAGINGSVADAFALALTYAMQWQGGSGEVSFEPNLDFVDISMKPEEITALVALYQAGGISLDTLLWNLQQGEKLDPSRTIKQEKQLIEKEKASAPADLPLLTPEERAALGLPGLPEKKLDEEDETED